MRLAKQFLKSNSGATAVEYALICSLVFLGIVVAINNFASKSQIMYGNIATNMK